jgi:adenine-specific DNA-methyltransferase
MAKIEITKTELVWPGKYNEDGTLKEVPRVSLPFQVIERVNESRATREARKGGVQQSLFDVWEGKEGDTFEEGWRNKLIWGDNLLVMGSLLEKFAGKIDLIYIDPPFATGADFSFRTEIGDSGEEVTKEQSVIEEKAYRDTWGAGIESYLNMLFPRLALMRDLLSGNGSLYVHIDYRLVHYVFCLLVECFGVGAFKNDIVWSYGGRGAKAISGQFPRNHDVLLVFAKGEPTYNRVYQDVLYDVSALPSHIKLEPDGRPFKTSPRGDYTDASVARLESEGRIYRTRNGGVRVKYHLERRGNQVIEKNLVGDVWDDIPDMMHAPRDERLDFPTQKPERLLERVIEAASNAGDLVADFFCGSGTTLAVAEKLGRRWIGCDLGRWAIHVTRKRLLSIPNCKPFEVLNLGKYERQYWQGVTFGDKKDQSVTEQKLYEYLAFILRLYGAQPVAGMAHLHGKKGKAMVHIGAVDAPVTIDEINQALDECVALKQTELHVLGWEWEMGLAGPNNEVRKGSPMHEIARQKGVKLLLLQIPREVMEQQAAEKGDVRFFELAYFEAKISQPKKLTVQVELKDFATPNADLVPEDVRSKIKKWSDYIDYWAVDWDFQNDTFMQGWVAYRTRKERKLPLVSDPHTYEKPGKYRILVKVFDIFGNDTSQAFDVEVK